MNIIIGNPCIRPPKLPKPSPRPIDPGEVAKKIGKTIFEALLRK